LEILAKREDIADVIADPQTDPETARRLQRVLEIRTFAIDELGLPDNRSYTYYADLEREAVVWNVMATPRFSLEPKTWCYPIAGCVSYRGYFRHDGAAGMAEDLARDGWDVAVLPVSAYSTLGWFADPVLNTFLGWEEPRLAGVIFHELAHQKVWVPGETDFNESYATFVEREGIRRWLEASDRPGASEEWFRTEALARDFRRLILDGRQRLEEIYDSDLDEPAMEAARQSGFETLRADYAGFRQRWGDHRYDGWMAREINNAHLAGFSTYEAGTDAFAGLLDEVGGDMDAFHRAVAAMADADKDTRRKFLQDSD